MDTNMSQALKMAGGILIAIIIISTLTYFFREITPSQQQIEDIEALEQTAEFNKQYEVYNKSLMLGIDIISVINKAYSNNVAYIEAYGYSEEIKDNYLIDIQLNGGIELEQTLDLRLVTWVDDRVKEKSINVSDLESESKSDLNNLIGDEPKDEWEHLILSDGICLIDNSNDYTTDVIYDNIILNIESKKIFNNNFNNNEEERKEDWTRAIFETYAYNLKTKKFKCIGIENSKITGRIIKMTFEEI